MHHAGTDTYKEKLSQLFRLGFGLLVLALVNVKLKIIEQAGTTKMLVVGPRHNAVVYITCISAEDTIHRSS